MTRRLGGEHGVELRSAGLGVPEPTGQFSIVGHHRGSGLVAVSGQVARDEQDRLVGPGDAALQTERTLTNLATVLGAVGLGWPDVLKLTTYLVGSEHLDAFAEGRARYWASALPDGPYPPSSLVVVAGLTHPGYLVEIEALAVSPPA